MSTSNVVAITGKSLPPYGGSGLKCVADQQRQQPELSPSIRREWIEIYEIAVQHGYSGSSPSIRREWIEMTCHGAAYTADTRLPPYGGSGLKCRR